MSDLKGLNAYVTGASRGIGKVLAEKLADCGVNVALVSRNLKESQKVASAIAQKTGVQTWAMQADVSDPQQIQQLGEELKREVQHLDIALNNAGVCKHQTAFETSYEDWCYILNINLTGVFLSSKMAAELMLNRGGSIINMASMSGGIVTNPQSQCAYGASKAGVLHLTKSLAVEWAPYKIRVNSISPGYIATEMVTYIPKEMQEIWFSQTPIPRFGQPEEIFNAVAYLASPDSSFTTGSDLLIDGGFTCL